jgi:hypothetical protein
LPIARSNELNRALRYSGTHFILIHDGPLVCL